VSRRHNFIATEINNGFLDLVIFEQPG